MKLTIIFSAILILSACGSQAAQSNPPDAAPQSVSKPIVQPSKATKPIDLVKGKYWNGDTTPVLTITEKTITWFSNQPSQISEAKLIKSVGDKIVGVCIHHSGNGWLQILMMEDGTFYTEDVSGYTPVVQPSVKANRSEFLVKTD